MTKLLEGKTLIGRTKPKGNILELKEYRREGNSKKQIYVDIRMLDKKGGGGDENTAGR